VLLLYIGIDVQRFVLIREIVLMHYVIRYGSRKEARTPRLTDKNKLAIYTIRTHQT